VDNRENIAAHELIPLILGSCADLREARGFLERINLTDDPFDSELGGASLHWILADKSGAITFEVTESGARIYENAVGVLTNEPSFDFHILNLAGYGGLSPSDPVNTFCNGVRLPRYSKGMGAIGLPGDVSSASRFVRAAFNNLNSVCEEDGVSQFFHVISSVEQIRGADRTKDGFEITHYTSCCDMDSGVYYFTTYKNRTISAVDMKKADIDGKSLITFSIATHESVRWLN
jgi:choloylglycine hydrolase